MANSLTTSFALTLSAAETSVEDMGTAIKNHIVNPTGALATGTGDTQADRIWSDQRTLVATTETIDLAGSLTAAIGGATITFVEVRAIYIRNTATAAASVLTVGGNGSNPAFAGLFADATDKIKVGPSGVFFWYSPLDTAGLVPTAATADLLKIDSGAATITYDIIIIGVSA